MSSLDKIQKLSKLGKILCSIVFVFCVIGIIGSVVGIAFLAADIPVGNAVFIDHFVFSGKTISTVQCNISVKF